MHVQLGDESQQIIPFQGYVNLFYSSELFHCDPEGMASNPVLSEQHDPYFVSYIYFTVPLSVKHNG